MKKFMVKVEVKTFGFFIKIFIKIFGSKKVVFDNSLKGEDYSCKTTAYIYKERYFITNIEYKRCN